MLGWEYQVTVHELPESLARKEGTAFECDQDGLCFVAEAEGKIVGFNLARELYVGIPLSKICVIQGIVVHDDYRRLGIGEKLVQAVLEHCVKHNIEAVRALVYEGDTRLQQFAEFLGFRRSMVANFDKVIA